jgi:hypothetical protein
MSWTLEMPDWPLVQDHLDEVHTASWVTTGYTTRFTSGPHAPQRGAGDPVTYRMVITTAVEDANYGVPDTEPELRIIQHARAEVWQNYHAAIREVLDVYTAGWAVTSSRMPNRWPGSGAVDRNNLGRTMDAVARATAYLVATPNDADWLGVTDGQWPPQPI